MYYFIYNQLIYENCIAISDYNYKLFVTIMIYFVLPYDYECIDYRIGLNLKIVEYEFHLCT